jgi:hypothetical protein
MFIGHYALGVTNMITPPPPAVKALAIGAIVISALLILWVW